MHSSPFEPLILDIGHDTCRAGFATSLQPATTVCSVLGYDVRVIAGCSGLRDGMIGKQVFRAGLGNGYRQRRYLSLHGSLLNGPQLKMGMSGPDDHKRWGKVDFFDYLFPQIFQGSKGGGAIQSGSQYDLSPESPPREGIAPEAQVGKTPLIVVEDVLSSAERRKQRGVIVEKLFEMREPIPAIAFVLSPLCSLTGSEGSASGLVVGMGASFCSVVGVVEGQVGEAGKLPIGGKDVTNEMNRFLSDRGYEMTSRSETEIIEQMKREIGFVAVNVAETRAQHIDPVTFDWHNSHCAPIEYDWKLPDGGIITAGAGVFLSSEILFQSSRDRPGLIELTELTLSIDCGVSMRRRLQKNILLCGGTAQTRNMVRRFEEDLIRPETNSSGFDPSWNESDFDIRLEKQMHSSWVGASALCRSGFLESAWISIEEYNEIGRDCFVRHESLAVDSHASWIAYSGEDPDSDKASETLKFLKAYLMYAEIVLLERQSLVVTRSLLEVSPEFGVG